MKFNGRIIYHRHIDWMAYYRDNNNFPSKIILPSDYETGDTYPMAEVEGKFGDDFCSGVSPLLIQEYPDGPTRIAEIQLSQELLDRLKRDNDTSRENLDKLRDAGGFT